MNGLWAVVRKEMIHLLRDKRTLRMIILMPFLQLMIYGFAINTDVKHMATVLYDEDRSPLSRRLVEAFVQSAYFDITETASHPAAIRRALDRNRAKVGLHIPPGFARDVYAGRSPSLQLLVDGSDSNPANTAVNTGQAIVNAFLQREGLIATPVIPIQFRPRMWYNPDLKTTYFMIPGLIGLLIQFLIPMISAAAIVREKENGTIEQLLVTPIRPYQVMIGKLIPYVGVGMVIATLIIAVANLIFGVPIRGHLITLYVLTLLFITVCLGIGMFASTVASNQQQAAQIVMFFAMPSILLSGFIFPRETMPMSVYALGQLIPLTYFLRIVRGIILKGLGFADLWDQILPLLAMAAFILTVSIKKFHKRLA